MKTNRRKQSNMDHKDRILSKFTHGRTKSLRKRKRTLLIEYKMINKSNRFVDRRIGEKNRKMTADDRVMARFVAQRIKTHNKKKIFNLDHDEEILTHKGRTLQDIEKFENPVSDSDDEDGGLDASFVKKAHFGGGLFTKSSDSESNRQNTIDQLILESKRQKAERQQIKEESQILTDKLDNELKNLFPMFDKKKHEKVENNGEVKPTPESYDVLVRELRFERVGKASDKLKSEIEIAYDERKKLEKFEKERLERMKRNLELCNEEEEPIMKKHISADDLDDGFQLDVCDDDDDDDDDDMCRKYYPNSNENVNYNDLTKKIVDNTVENRNFDGRKHLSVVPQTVENLLQELDGKTIDEKIEVIQNLVRAQRIHIGVSVKKNLINFFRVLIEYIDSLFVALISEDSWTMVSRLCPVLFELAQVDCDETAKIMFDLLKIKKQNYIESGRHNISLNVLIILKIIPLLFPASDYCHAVVSPMMVFLCQLLSENSCKSMELIMKGLFLITVMLECIHLSKRYCPEVITFLRNLLYISIPDFEDVCTPVSRKNKALMLNSKVELRKIGENLRLDYSHLCQPVSDCDENKVLIIYATVQLISKYYGHYKSYSTNAVVWKPVLDYLNKLPIHLYPNLVAEEIKRMQFVIGSSLEKPMNYLIAVRKRPKALRLYEPNIRPIIEGKSFRTVSQAKVEKEKLVHQYKKEMKGALREIRKDKDFLSRVKISEQAKKDAERKEKVKQIFGWGQSQQSELQRMERKNRRRK